MWSEISSGASNSWSALKSSSGRKMGNPNISQLSQYPRGKSQLFEQALGVVREVENCSEKNTRIIRWMIENHPFPRFEQSGCLNIASVSAGTKAIILIYSCWAIYPKLNHCSRANRLFKGRSSGLDIDKFFSVSCHDIAPDAAHYSLQIQMHPVPSSPDVYFNHCLLEHAVDLEQGSGRLLNIIVSWFLSPSLRDPE
jgi:hypothetical protein